VSIVDRVEEIKPILVDWLDASGGTGRCRRGRSLADEEFRATEAELNALLGRDVDD
jgi:hypothetical protein